MAKPYSYQRKIENPNVWNGSLVYSDLMIGNQRALLEIGILSPPNKIIVVKWTIFQPSNRRLDVEWRLLLLNPKKEVLQQRPVVKCRTTSVNWISYSNDNLVEPYFYVTIEVDTSVSIPIVGRTENFPAEEMKITVGESREMCLHLPLTYVDCFPSPLREQLLEKRTVHIDNWNARNLVDFASLAFDDSQFYYSRQPYSHEQMLRCGILHMKFPKFVTQQVSSPIFIFCKNFKKMQKVRCVEDQEAFVWLQNPDFKSAKFDKPEDAKSWFQVICENLNINLKGHWKLSLFSTKYNDVPYFGFTLTSVRKAYLFKYDIKMELKGFIESQDGPGTTSQTLTFVLSPHGGSSPYYSISSPVLTTIKEVERIGMDHQHATVTLNFEDSDGHNCCLRTITFPGITNYNVKLGDYRITADLEVLQASSKYFAAISNKGFVESKSDTLRLDENDAEALVVLLKIVYGCATPLTYPLLGNLIVLANKYMFTDLVRYFDTMLAIIASKNRLPQLWADNVVEIAKQAKLLELKAHFDDEVVPNQYRSEVVPEDGHMELLDRLAIKPKVKEDVYIPVAHRTRKRLRDD